MMTMLIVETMFTTLIMVRIVVMSRTILEENLVVLRDTVVTDMALDFAATDTIRTGGGESILLARV